MAIAFAGGANSSLAFGVSSQAVTFGATPANDEIILLAYVQTAAGPATRTWPTGFTEILTDSSGGYGGNVVLSAAWKRAASEGSATYTLSLSDALDNNQQLIGGRYTGAFATGDPFDVKSTPFGGYASPQNAPDITTLTDNAWHVILHGSSDNAGTVAATGYTNDYQPGTNPRLALLHKVITPAGATGAVSVSGMSGSGNPNILYSLSLKPSGGAATVNPPRTVQFVRQAVARAGSR